MNSIAYAIKHLRRGGAIILLDQKDRENEGDLAFAASHCSKELVNDCLNIARGLLCVAMTKKDADRIGISRLPTNNKGVYGTPFGMPVDLDDGSSGVSAGARSATIRAISKPACELNWFVSPGHIHTLIGHENGLSGRMGHTEAIIDLMSIAKIPSPGVLCEILNSQGDIANSDELMAISKMMGWPIVHVESILEHLNTKLGETCV